MSISPNKLKPTNSNEPTRLDSKPTQIPHGASLISDKFTNRQGAERLQESHDVWGDNPNNDSFVTLLRILRNQPQGIKLQTAIMRSRPNTKHYLQQSLATFSKDTENDAKYDREYRQKSHIGLTMEQLGFKKGAAMQQCQELDDLWKRLIEVTAIQLSTNKLTTYKILRRFVQQEGLFRKLYQAQIGGNMLKPDNEQIALFFKNGPNGKEIDEDSVDFIAIFSRMVENFFNQANSCIYCIIQIFEENIYQGLMSLFETANDFSMFSALWYSYCKLSEEILKPNNSRKTTQKYTDLKKMMFNMKTKLLMNIIKLFYSFTANFPLERLTVPTEQNFMEKMVKKLDGDIILFEKSDRGQNIDSFSRFIVELFLTIFPFQQFEKNRNKISSVTNDIKSESLKLVKLVFSNEHIGKVMKQFQEMAKSGEWNAYSSKWKKWLGVFLFKYKKQLNKNTREVTKKIVTLCKYVVADDYAVFWEQDNGESMDRNRDRNKEFYLNQIKQFIKQVVIQEYQSTNINDVSILPICTKLLGKIYKRYSEQVINLLTPQVVESIFFSITQNLQLDSTTHQKQRYQKIVYYSQDDRHNMDLILQQEIKFICRMIQIQADDLSKIQYCLLSNYGFNQKSPASGAHLIIKFLQIFYSISPDTVSGVKCLRYLIKSINSLFICVQTRSLVCIALAACDSGKNNYSKALKAIVSCCYDYQKSSQLGRQTEKLRNAISYHLNCIVKVSDNLEQYFPTTMQRESTQQYRKLYDYLTRQQTREANQYICQLRQKCAYGFKPVQWFYQFIKLLESSRLSSIDLDTIRLLLLKMRIKDEQTREYFNLSAIVDILNHGKVQDIIIKTLTPIVKKDKSTKQRAKHFLGLANREIEGLMPQSAQRQYLKGPKYQSKSYRFFKEKYIYNKQRLELYSKISSCLSIIETMLRLGLEGDFPLLKKLKINKFILQSLFSDKPYMYDVKFTFSIQKPVDERNSLASFLGRGWQERQMSSSINLMHCIASYWDFEHRLNIDDSEHPSNSIKLAGHFQIDIIDKKLKQNLEIIYLSQQNILTDINRRPESVGVGTISKILQYIVLLGGGKNLYYSVLLRNYPISRGIATNSNLSIMQEFMEGISYTAMRHSSSLRQRQHIMELFSVLIREKHFGDYIRNNIHKFKQAFTRGREFSGISKSTRLITQMLNFLNMLLQVDSSEKNVKFAKSCLSDPIEFGTKLISHCQNRISQLIDIQEDAKKSKYGTFQWVLTAREAALCKLALLLYLGLASYFISNQHQSLAQSLSDLILKNSSIFLKPIQIKLTEQSSQRLQSLNLKQSLRVPTFVTQKNQSHFVVNQLFLSAILLNLPYSFVDNYLQQPWQVLQNSPPKQAKKLILITYRYNAIKAFFYANEALIQYYYLFTNSLLKRGQSGLFFTTQAQKIITNKMPPIILFKKQKARNQVPSRLLIGESEGFSNCCFRISRDIERQIWQDEKCESLPPRDVGLMLIGEIICSLQGRITVQGHHLAQYRRITDKFLNQLSVINPRFHFSVFVNTLNSLQRLSQKILHATLTKKQNDKIVYQSYFKRIQQSIICLQKGVCLDDISKMTQDHLQIFIFQCLSLIQLQIDNVHYIQKNGYNISSYLQNDSRFIIFQNFKTIVNRLVSFMALPDYSSSIIILILQILSKNFSLSHISRKYRVGGTNSSFNKDIFIKIQKMYEKMTNDDEILSTYLLRFMMEAFLFGQGEQNRQIMKVLKTGFLKNTQKVDKIAELKTLSEIIKNSSLLGAFSSLSLQQNWKNEQFQGTLDQLFFMIQKKPLKFSCQKIIPESQIQNELSNKYLREIKRGRNISLFSLFAELCMYELINNYLLFVSFSIKHSPSLSELCNNTFNKGPLEDLTLERLRQSLINAINFMNNFSMICFSNQIEDILKINSFTCIDGQFIRQMNLLSLCFQNYQNKADFYSNIIDTLSLLYETVTLLCQTWEKYDWKSIADWAPNRKDLLLQFQKLVIFYKGMFKDCKEVLYQKHLVTIVEYIRNDLQGYKF